MSGDDSPRLILENRHSGERLAVRRVAIGGETCFELVGSLPPGREGPPLHVHFAEDEEGRVLSGVLAASVGGRQLVARAGESVSLPRGVAHRWWNAGDETLHFAGMVRPAVDFDRYLQAMFAVLNAGAVGRPPLFYVAHAALRHRRTQRVLLLPRPIQAVVFRLAVAVGTVLGKYRGDDWPGAPSRCTGAP